MKQQLRKLSLLLALLMLVSLTALAEPAAQLPEKMKVEYSTAFSVEYLGDGVKLVTDAENRQLLLVPREQKAPEGFPDAIVIPIPVENALFASTTQVGMLNPYKDGFKGVGGVMYEPGGWPFPEIEEGLKDGSIKFVGNSSAPDYEAVQELNPEITFVYTGAYGQTDIIAKLDELGLPYAVDNEYLEGTAEGRMEWTKFLAAFFNLDDEAVAYVDKQLEGLAQMQEKVKDAPKPKVAWGSIYQGTVYVPNGESYVAKAIAQAGGDYLFKDLEGAGSNGISVEEFFNTLTEADVFIYSASSLYMPDMKALEEAGSVLMDAKCVKEGNVWQFGINYYYDTDKADIQVLDLAAIFHPDLYPDYEITQYNKLAK